MIHNGNFSRGLFGVEGQSVHLWTQELQEMEGKRARKGIEDGTTPELRAKDLRLSSSSPRVASRIGARAWAAALLEGGSKASTDAGPTPTLQYCSRCSTLLSRARTRCRFTNWLQSQNDARACKLVSPGTCGWRWEVGTSGSLRNSPKKEVWIDDSTNGTKVRGDV